MEPERPIEKLLRAFAKKRREQAGAPMELHSAMRQQLQKEIERRSVAPSGGGWLSKFLFGLRPRLVFAICFVGMLIMGLMFLPRLTHPKPSTLASLDTSRKEAAPADKAIPALRPPPASAAAPAVAGERRQALQDEKPAAPVGLALAPTPPEPANANRQLAVPSAETTKQPSVLKSDNIQTEASTGVTVASAPPAGKEMYALTADAPAANNSFGGASALGKDAATQSLPSTPTPQAIFSSATNTTLFAANDEEEKKLNAQKQSVAAAPTGAAFFDRVKSETPAAMQSVSQAFNRTDTLITRRRAVDTLNGSTPVLLSFRVEQNGNAMRVVDADGSVYTGAVQVAQAAGAARVAPPKNAPTVAQAARVPAPSQSAQNYFFRVAGTNRNLNQNVVFSGNFVPLTNAALVVSEGSFGGFGGAAPAAGLPSDFRLSNSQISGTAVIGDQKAIEVLATPAP